MKKKTKWILGSTASLIVLLCLGGFVYYHFFFTIDIDMSGLFDARPIKKVNLIGWEKLEKGMTKQEVTNLLGESDSKFGRGIEDNISQETWEYNWSIGLRLFGNVHPKAYTVHFGHGGKLASWREPVEKENEEGEVGND